MIETFSFEEIDYSKLTPFQKWLRDTNCNVLIKDCYPKFKELNPQLPEHDFTMQDTFEAEMRIVHFGT